jgi:hypothetical protein
MAGMVPGSRRGLALGAAAPQRGRGMRSRPAARARRRRDENGHLAQTPRCEVSCVAGGLKIEANSVVAA